MLVDLVRWCGASAIPLTGSNPNNHGVSGYTRSNRTPALITVKSADGGRWKQSVDQTIREIESREWEFFVAEGGRTVDVIVATHNGNKYIKTTADGIQPDNLLSLPECP
ncbi:DUF3892 domain-containing protein [Bradyrhizobium tunisiense]|uniref:DUF3892 domain-containing protein n=1 Tax=Bradyrhizobium tunisiense TaxID=3278709 RepID=UPI0035DCBFAE